MKQLKLNKRSIEGLNQETGMVELHRGMVGRYQVYLAEAFSMYPGIKFRRFGINGDDFPFGCYMMMLWIARTEDRFDVGIPMFFAADHDMNRDMNLALADRQQARMNTALDIAKKFVDQLKKAKVNGKPH